MILNVEELFRHLPRIETDHLVLRKMRRSDARDLFAYASNPEVTRYTMWNTHRTLRDSELFLDAIEQRYRDGQVTNWGIEHKSSGKFIGTCGFVYWAPEHQRAEIGYALSADFWNQGLMSEAANAVLQFGFQKMDLNRLEARCNLANTGSERVMQKLGMTYEGVIREQLFIRGQFESVKLYSILRHEVTFEPFIQKS
ncbi:GNAT family N-acetyltransferase [Paenibacillus guangzhouensis]|uniref:GNAT family N-acetyltransferase n=1 Tax=Paenibacillus guangzhouensis TaxID=1473112 RepID=UPI001D0F602A|nr:GNAT family N-acetyltransferase [Paenibacillus guangzhouensis]